MAFNRVIVLSQWLGPPEEASRTFDRMRAGLVLAEGAAVVVVENEAEARQRGARIYAHILGHASATESEHLRKVDETGGAVSRAMTMALRDSDLTPEDIDYVCAHGK